MMSNLPAHLLATYTYNYSYSGSSTSSHGFGAIVLVIILIALIICVISIVGMWKTFTKAGRPGWAAIIPLYNTWTLAEIGGWEGWYGLYPIIGIIPFLGSAVVLVINIILGIKVAEKFGKGGAFGAFALGIFAFVGYPILGFGSAQYEGQGNQITGSGPAGFPPNQTTPPTNGNWPTEPAPITPNVVPPVPQPTPVTPPVVPQQPVEPGQSVTPVITPQDPTQQPPQPPTNPIQ